MSHNSDLCVALAYCVSLILSFGKVTRHPFLFLVLQPICLSALKKSLKEEKGEISLEHEGIYSHKKPQVV